MAARKNPPKKAPWRRHKPGRPREREKIIFEALEKAPGTFEELCKRVPLARTTLSEGLAELEDQGRIERRIGSLKERGRGKRHRVIIQLSEAELTPVAKTLRHLKELTVTPRIDDEEGRALLTEDVVDGLLEFATLGFEPPTGILEEYPLGLDWLRYWGWITYKERREERRKELIKSFGGYDQIPKPLREMLERKRKPELDEYFLLKALARYDVERNMIPEAISGGFGSLTLQSKLWGYGDLWLTREELTKLYQDTKNPRFFPIIARAKKVGISQKLDKLLEWIRPLLEGEWLEEALVKRPYRGIVPLGENLAAHFFSQEREGYLDELGKARRSLPIKHRAPHPRGEKEKKRGGEKA